MKVGASGSPLRGSTMEMTYGALAATAPANSGHKCCGCGCCCSSRVAVIVVDIISVVFAVVGLSLMIFADVAIWKSPELFDDDQFKQGYRDSYGRDPDSDARAVFGVGMGVVTVLLVFVVIGRGLGIYVRVLIIRILFWIFHVLISSSSLGPRLG